MSLEIDIRRRGAAGLTIALVAAVLVALSAPSALADITVRFVGPELWGADDEALGLGGGVVEDFEDLPLAPGLEIEIADAAGQFTGEGWTTLPAVFDPVNGDPYGDAFATGVWDGQHVLVNTAGNQAIDYGSPDWRPVALRVPGGAAWIAVASQQVTVNHVLVVNDQPLGRLAALGFNLGADRNGLLVVASDDPGQPVFSVRFGGGGDAFVLDHVVFAPVGQVADGARTWGGIKARYR